MNGEEDRGSGEGEWEMRDGGIGEMGNVASYLETEFGGNGDRGECIAVSVQCGARDVQVDGARAASSVRSASADALLLPLHASSAHLANNSLLTCTPKPEHDSAITRAGHHVAVLCHVALGSRNATNEATVPKHHLQQTSCALHKFAAQLRPWCPAWCTETLLFLYAFHYSASCDAFTEE